MNKLIVLVATCALALAYTAIYSASQINALADEDALEREISASRAKATIAARMMSNADLTREVR